jgi:TetR/AcrR family transcriptional regulator
MPVTRKSLIVRRMSGIWEVLIKPGSQRASRASGCDSRTARNPNLHPYLNKRLILTMSTANQPRRKRARMPGRPVVGTDEDVRSALLDAAGKLFLKYGFERVTARQIAAGAGTTPAMIHYYFTNKLGLFRAMLDRAIQPLRERLAGLLMQSDGALDVPSLIAMHMRTVATHSWIPVFILNEVLVEKGRFRATFIREIASRQLPLVVELLERGRAAGNFRPDLDCRFAALSLLSLCMFPFLTRPVSATVLGLKYEGEDLERLIEHTAKLFLNGITNKTEPRA